MNGGVTMQAAVHNVYTHQTSAKLCQAVNTLGQMKWLGREISLRRIVIGGTAVERLSFALLNNAKGFHDVIDHLVKIKTLIRVVLIYG
jgi:hypothetical protein